MEFQFLYALQGMHNDILDSIMIMASTLGNGGVVWLLAAFIMLAFKKTRKCGGMIILSMLICFLLGNIALKNIIQRPRPFQVDTSIVLKIPTPGEYSFPSGHTLHGFTAATMIFLQYRKAGTIALALAALIAFSRMYLFVHFPTDVLGGMLLGIGVALYVYHRSTKKVTIK